MDSTHIRALLAERKFEEAEQYIQKELEQTSQDSDVILLKDYLSTICRETGRIDEAIEHAKASLTAAEKILDDKDLTLANVLHNLSMTLDMAQRYEEAIPFAERELSILRGILPDSDKRIAHCLLSLAKHHYELGRMALAKDMIKDCMDRFTKLEGENGLGVSACLNNLGRILENEGENEQAIPLFERAVAIRKNILGTHPDTAFTLLNLGTALTDLGRYREAAQALMESRDMYVDLGLEDSPYLEAARDNLMLCFNKACTPC